MQIADLKVIKCSHGNNENELFLYFFSNHLIRIILKVISNLEIDDNLTDGIHRPHCKYLGWTIYNMSRNKSRFNIIFLVESEKVIVREVNYRDAFSTF